MENAYTCRCGNQTWSITDSGVHCTACEAIFPAQVTPVKEFNHKVTEEMEELEEA